MLAEHMQVLGEKAHVVIKYIDIIFNVIEPRPTD